MYCEELLENRDNTGSISVKALGFLCSMVEVTLRLKSFSLGRTGKTEFPPQLMLAKNLDILARGI